MLYKVCVNTNTGPITGSIDIYYVDSATMGTAEKRALAQARKDWPSERGFKATSIEQVSGKLVK